MKKFKVSWNRQQLRREVAFTLLLVLAISSSLVLALINNLWSLEISGSRKPNFNSAPASHPRITYWQGLEMLRNGQSGQVVQLMDEKSLFSSQDIMSNILLGKAYESEGQVANAIQIWSRAGAWDLLIEAANRSIDNQRWQDAVSYLDNARNNRPQEVVSFYARAYAGLQKWEVSIKFLQKALGDFPESGHRQLWLLTLGNYLSQQNNWAEALIAYKQATELPDDGYLADACIYFGRAIYYDRYQFDEAVVQIKKGISIRPDKADGYLVMGDLMRSEKHFNEADSWYAQAASRNSKNIWIVVKRVDNLFETGNLDLAFTLVKKGQQDFPEQPHLYYQEAVIYRKQGNLDLAIETAKNSITRDSIGNLSYILNLGSLYEQTKRFPEAISTYESVLAIDPTNKIAKDSLNRLRIYK
jgi:tetratricopeptide (TPR) repeat protein